MVDRRFGGQFRALQLTPLLLALLAAGCAGRTGPIAYDPPGFTAPTASAVDSPSQPAPLGPGDVVTIRVFRADAFSGDQTIDEAGRIKLPLIGALAAAGKTTDALEAEIAAALGARYLTAPDVRVTLKAPLLRTVTVDGAIAQPGVYPVTGETTLMRAIAMARGTAEGANTRRVAVFRTIDGQRMAAGFDLRAIRAGAAPDPVIYPDDIVVVDGSAVSASWKMILQSLPFVALFRPFG